MVTPPGVAHIAPPKATRQRGFILKDDCAPARGRYIARAHALRSHRLSLSDLALAAAVVTIELLDMDVFASGGRHDPLDAGLLIASGAVLLARRRAPLMCALAAAALTTILAAR